MKTYLVIPTEMLNAHGFDKLEEAKGFAVQMASPEVKSWAVIQIACMEGVAEFARPIWIDQWKAPSTSPVVPTEAELKDEVPF